MITDDGAKGLARSSWARSNPIGWLRDELRTRSMPTLIQPWAFMQAMNRLP